MQAVRLKIPMYFLEYRLWLKNKSVVFKNMIGCQRILISRRKI
jgi:hypothetical protein